MRVKVLYPTTFIGLIGEEPEAGSIVNVPDAIGKSLIAGGEAEAAPSKPKSPAKATKKDEAPVESASAAPGEKRNAKTK